MDFEVIGIEIDGTLICKSDDGQVYNCGETLEEFGINNLRVHELRNLGFEKEAQELENEFNLILKENELT